VSKRLSAVGNKKDFAIFDTAREPHSQIIALVDSRWVFFSVVVVLYSYIVDMPLFKAWSEDKLNKKCVVAEILPVHV